ncbi:MAG TPA: magnesium transporter [Gammaproteobacteria bacterium]
MTAADLQNDGSTTPLEALRAALGGGTMRNVARLLSALNPAEIAALLESLPPEQRRLLWPLVEPAEHGDVLVELNEEVRSRLIADLQPEQLVEAVANLELDDLADLVRELPEAVNREVLRSLNESDRRRLEAVLGYDEDTAGGLMNPDTLTVRGDVTVEVVLRYLRMRKELPSGVDGVFVVSRDGHYRGSLSFAKLLTSDPDELVADLMSTEPPSVPATMPATEVATFFENYDLVSAPVTDENGMLLGHITVDDVVDVIREEASHSVLSMAGLDEDDDMFAPVTVSARRRFVWLGVNLAAAFVAARVAGLFEATLEEVVALAILLPIVPSMGGVAGNQTMVLITRGLALGRVARSNARWLLVKELGVAVLNSVSWATVVALVTSWWFGTWRVGLVIAAALAVNLLCAALAGFGVPLTLKRLRVDPALAGGVVVTTITDVVGIAAFLGLGTLILT